ncbi:hypothetical protein ElyMa_005292300 [Elysia marginata]|uniref:Immunoglobulin domain-containing protein n=1 Tax=Elysia marginata TaxID=1093978 RepID=A0AAV4K117_9GAST|nr:hypothetical protein ElyMa_005292300 [Elysia marginata]
MAGFDVAEVKVIWSLALRRLSESGCNPKDPVMTLVELGHVHSSSEGDQMYQFVDGPSDWAFHAEGAALNKDMTNAHTAWVGLTIGHALLEDSGTYRCDALAGEIDDSLPKTSKSSFIEFSVSAAPGGAFPGFTHMALTESIHSLDYDSSVIQPEENHRRVGQSVNISCSPRLLRNAPRFPFHVSRAEILFLPFNVSGSEFIVVASYAADRNTFEIHPPSGRVWELHHTKRSRKSDRVLDSSRLRLDINIPAVTSEDTGIFICAVTKTTTGNTFLGEAGLKVSNDPNLHSGYCEPSKHQGEGLLDLNKIFPQRDKDDLDLGVAALRVDEIKESWDEHRGDLSG